MSNNSDDVQDVSKKFSYFDVLKRIFPWKGDSVGEVIRKVLFLTAVVVLAVSSGLIFDYFYQNYKNKKLYDEMNDFVPKMAELINPEIDNSSEDGELNKYVEDLRRFFCNTDIIGYISIDNTEISYPVLQTPNEGLKDYYLDHNPKKEEAKAGSIYMDWRNYIEPQDRSDNLIIYGHEMHDGSMFGKLDKYKKCDYFMEHPVVTLMSRYDVVKYKIFGAFYADSGEKGYECDFYYTSPIDFESEEDFFNYINQIKKRTLVNNNVDMKYGDELLILSTCATNYYNEARFVVAARRIRKGEDAFAGTQSCTENTNAYMPLEWYKKYGGQGSFDESLFVPYE